MILNSPRFLANKRECSQRTDKLFAKKRCEFTKHQMIYWIKALSYVKTSLVCALFMRQFATMVFAEIVNKNVIWHMYNKVPQYLEYYII